MHSQVFFCENGQIEQVSYRCHHKPIPNIEKKTFILCKQHTDLDFGQYKSSRMENTHNNPHSWEKWKRKMLKVLAFRDGRPN